MDLALIAVFKKTGGLEAYPHPGWAVQHPLKECEGLFEGQYLISIGFVVVMILCVPLGYVNLDDNVVVQEGASSVNKVDLRLTLHRRLLGDACHHCRVDGSVFRDWSRLRPCPVRWCALVPSSLSDLINFPIGKNQAGVLGTLVFNYAFVVTVPSWVNEKVHCNVVITLTPFSAATSL